jgi:hypothetical protein
VTAGPARVGCSLSSRRPRRSSRARWPRLDAPGRCSGYGDDRHCPHHREALSAASRRGRRKTGWGTSAHSLRLRSFRSCFLVRPFEADSIGLLVSVAAGQDPSASNILRGNRIDLCFLRAFSFLHSRTPARRLEIDVILRDEPRGLASPWRWTPRPTARPRRRGCAWRSSAMPWALSPKPHQRHSGLL